MEIYWLMLFGLLLAGKNLASKDKKIVLLTRQPNACTYGSNVIRDVHTVPKLSWDKSLNDGAEDWAIRCALKKVMEFSGLGYGEVIYWTIGKSVSCENPLFSWYSGIKNYDYDKPKWTQKDGTFIQIVYSTVSKFGLATASFDNQIFVIGRYDQPIFAGGSLDLDHVPKPKQNVTKDDLVPQPRPAPKIIEIPIPDNEDGWTDWVTTSQCTTKNGDLSGTSIEERWCIRLKEKKACEGPRKRNTPCRHYHHHHRIIQTP